MQTPSRVSLYSVIGLVGFGVAYDSGLFGTPDGHDHSAMISISSSTTSSVVVSGGVVYGLNAVTGDDFAVPLPAPPKPTQG
jgi:hypothetical protein